MLTLLLRELKEELRETKRRLQLKDSVEKCESIDFDANSSLPTSGVVCLVRW
jgi:hypothetical protein